MKRWTTKDGIALVIWLLPAVYLAAQYQRLPATVPVHFDATGQPDRYGNRAELWWVVLLLMGVAAAVYLLMKFLPSIDPKRTARYSGRTFNQLAFVLLLFMTAMGIGILYTTGHGSMLTERFMLPLVGLLFAYLGNMMHSLKPNYFVGIRTPWTLENEETWRKTHQLAGKLWLPGGLLITIAALLLPASVAVGVFMGAFFILILIPVVYSYIYYKKVNA